MSKNLPKDIKKHLMELLTDDDIQTEEIVAYVVNNCSDYHLTPTQLAMIFERYCGLSCNDDPKTISDKSKTFTRAVPIDELVQNVHPGFRTSNGCDWARSDSSYLGKRYEISRDKKSGSVYSVKLEGANKSSIRHMGIREDIRKTICDERCVILDIGTNIECDHKDGHYDNMNNASKDTQVISDYQPLSKAANDAKRSHCNKCKKTGKRYDATRLGYSEPYVFGDENTPGCDGCYWYDPHFFNEVISKDFRKDK